MNPESRLNATGSKWEYVRDYSRHKHIDEYLGQILGEGFRKYRQDWDAVSNLERNANFPLFLVFETLFKCNLKCIMCIHSSPNKKDYAYPERSKEKFENTPTFTIVRVLLQDFVPKPPELIILCR